MGSHLDCLLVLFVGVSNFVSDGKVGRTLIILQLSHVKMKNFKAGPLRGKSLSLQPLSEEHRTSLSQWMLAESTEEDFNYMSYGPFSGPEEFDLWFEQNLADSSKTTFTVVKDEEFCSGLLSLMREESKHKVVEVGSIQFSRALQRSREASEAIFLIMKHVFEEMNYRRLEWKCDSLNERSREAALRFGFRYEGLFRQHMIVKDKNRDTAWFSIVDSEWPAIKKEFSRWLSAENFQQGVQQTPLNLREG